jgi:DNA-binding LacI/PurR family transcriptional regulator
MATPHLLKRFSADKFAANGVQGQGALMGGTAQRLGSDRRRAGMADGAGERRTTLLDLAKAVGMSPATVSNALTGRRRVDAKTRETVRAAAERLGYVPNMRARSLRTGKADTIAIFSSMPFAIAGGPARMAYLMEIAAAAAERALQNGMALILVPPLADGPVPLGAFHADGAIVVEPRAKDREVELLKVHGIPAVAIGRPTPAAALPYVDCRHFDAATLMLEHLAAQAPRCLALVTGAQPRTAHREAERAYRRVMAGRGQEAVVALVNEEDGEEGAYRAVHDLLTRHPQIDAMFVSVDSFAIGARRAAAELGRRIPQDLRLATRFNGPHAQANDLTSLDLRLPDLGRQAVDLLARVLAGEKDIAPVEGPMPALVVRGSSRLPNP